MDAAERSYGPRECGSCRLWRAILEDAARGPLGPCRLGVRTGDFPGTAPVCERYLARDAALPAKPPPPATSRRPRATAPTVVRAAGAAAPVVNAVRPAAPSPPPPSVRAPADPGEPLPEDLLDMTREELTDLIREALRDENRHVTLAPKWEGGVAILKPRDPALQAKEIPLDQLFHKVVMIRDRLRVLEQKINANEKLTDAEKVDLQQYVTKCYGTLTTFNVLFREERDKFVGEKS
jgi:hypothetical protein